MCEEDALAREHVKHLAWVLPWPSRGGGPSRGLDLDREGLSLPLAEDSGLMPWLAWMTASGAPAGGASWLPEAAPGAEPRGARGLYASEL